MLFVVLAVLIGLIPAWIASSKGRSFFSWWFYGTLLFVVALAHALLIGLGGKKRRCPSCAEPIWKAAKVCPHCRSEISTEESSPKTATRRPVILLLVAIVGVAIFFPLIKDAVNGGFDEAPSTQSTTVIASDPSPAPPAKNDDEIKFDRNTAINSAKYDYAETGAVSCMDRLLHGYLMMGMRSREQLLGWATNICGKMLRQFLIQDGKQPSKIVDAHIRMLANNELDSVLRESGNQ